MADSFEEKQEGMTLLNVLRLEMERNDLDLTWIHSTLFSFTWFFFFKWSHDDTPNHDEMCESVENAKMWFCCTSTQETDV